MDYKILIYTFLACVGFCIVLHVHSPLRIAACALGGAIGWAVYLLLFPYLGELVCYFFATIAVTIYAEIMARLFKEPVTGFLLIGIIPMVPGGPLYYTMEYCINGETMLFLESALRTFGIAGALAVGVLVVSSFMRLFTMIIRNLKRNRVVSR